MSNRYKGGVISATPPTTTGGNDGVASGAWTLEQQMQAQAAGLWPNQPIFYIEDVFQTWLYTGNGGGSATGFFGTQTITNGINLSGKGGLVWIKSRSIAEFHALEDTARGVNKILRSNSTNAQNTAANTVTAFNTTGFNLGDDTDGYGTNTNAVTYVSWTFREQPKFFDVVTYTGNGAGQRDIAHNLGSVPGCVIIKRTDSSSVWAVWHRNNGVSAVTYFNLNETGPGDINSSYNAFTSSTTFTVDGIAGNIGSCNVNGATYVAYLFAHNAGGFGTSGNDNVISCGSYVGNGAAGGQAIDLGWEPQWFMIKGSNVASNWQIIDTMRGATVASGGTRPLRADLSNAEYQGDLGYPYATGFVAGPSTNTNNSGSSYIYIAIRRGPMAVPTLGTSVFSPFVGSDSSAISTGFPVDMLINNKRAGNPNNTVTGSRLIGSPGLVTSNTQPQSDGLIISNCWQSNVSYTPDVFGAGVVAYAYRRAPGFFDVVCYTGTGSATTVAHNLGVVPEFMIFKVRSAVGINWSCYHFALGNTQVISLNEDIQAYTSSQWNNTTPTSAVFSVGTQDNVNGSGRTYVAYLFATVAGVSKVGSYTGTGTTQTINCGFAAGSRFVMIKRTDEVASGNPWYVWDSARGIIPSNDPYLLLNSTAAEVTGTDYVDTTSVGFEISSTAPAAINASGGTFIFLAIA
jgi:hypothetical protein